MIDREIKFNRDTKDFDCLVDGRYVGSRPNYRAGDELCNEIAYDLAERGLVDTLPIECSEPDNHCELHNPCPAHAVDAARYLAEYLNRPARCATCGGEGYCPDCGTLFMSDDRPLLTDIAAVLDMALGHTHGSASIVSELRRIQARIGAVLTAQHMASVCLPNWAPADIVVEDLPY